MIYNVAQEGAAGHTTRCDQHIAALCPALTPFISPVPSMFMQHIKQSSDKHSQFNSSIKF